MQNTSTVLLLPAPPTEEPAEPQHNVLSSNISSRSREEDTLEDVKVLLNNFIEHTNDHLKELTKRTLSLRSDTETNYDNINKVISAHHIIEDDVRLIKDKVIDVEANVSTIVEATVQIADETNLLKQRLGDSARNG